MNNKKVTWDFEVEIWDKVPEKSYSRESWPKDIHPIVIYCKEEDQLFFIIDNYSVTILYSPKTLGFREAKPALEGSTAALLEAIAVMTHNKRLGT